VTADLAAWLERTLDEIVVGLWRGVDLLWP
jgi:hypothetical protein